MMNRFIFVVCKRQRYKVFYEANEPRRKMNFQLAKASPGGDHIGATMCEP